MLKGVFTNSLNCNIWLVSSNCEPWRVPHVGLEMLTLSGTPYFTTFGEFMISSVHYIYITECVNLRTLYYGLMTLFCLPGLVWLFCLPGLVWLFCLPGLVWLFCLPGLVWLFCLPGLVWLFCLPGLVWLFCLPGLVWLFCLPGLVWLFCLPGLVWLFCLPGLVWLFCLPGLVWLFCLPGLVWLFCLPGLVWLLWLGLILFGYSEIYLDYWHCDENRNWEGFCLFFSCVFFMNQSINIPDLSSISIFMIRIKNRSEWINMFCIHVSHIYLCLTHFDERSSPTSYPGC